MVDAAMAALDTLNKKDLGNCKTMAKPPAGVGDIFGAVVVLFAGINPNVIVQKNGKVKDKDRSWEATKKALLGNINALVEELKGFKTLVDDQQVPEVNWKEIRPFLALEHFNVEIIEKKNSAAAGLCAWVMNIVAYYDAIIVVEPKKRALEEANEKLRVANERLEMVNQKVTALEEKLATLTGEFDKVNQEVLDAVALLERGRLRMELARRLAKALGSESERWSHELEQLRVSAEMLVCDVVIAASFVSYVGAFTKPFRDVLINEKWLPFLRKSLAETSSKGDKDKPAPVSNAISGDGNPLQILATESEIAEWNTKGLPSDRVSVENGAIVRNSARAPLLIDPQLQELQAETTMINFAVTQQGLEDQLLALVVRKEWPKVAKVRTALIHQQNEFKIRIQTLEDRILSSLADAEGDVTENVQVITDLETTKATAQEIAIKAAKAKENEVQINELSAKYQSVASRGALLFFIMDGLHRMHSYYVYSLNAYVVIFQRGIDLVQSEKDPARPPSSGGGGDLLLADRVVENNSEQDLDALMKETDQQEMPSASQIETRCTQLKASITDVVFNYIRRGLFEKDKLTLATQLCFAILQSEKKIDAVDVRQLVTCASAADTGSGMGLLSEWMSETTWLRVRKLEENISSLQKLTTFMRSDSEEWREWCDSENPELKPLPGQYKTSITPMQLLHLIRVLRPDRMIFALRSFLGETFGKQMVQQPPFDMEAAYQETSASTPMFFVLFPGVDPTSWVEGLGKKFDFTYERGNLINISMGQGQEETADNVLMKFSREGNWVILQNIHLMQSWLPRLERTLEIYSVSADQNFRCFLSSEGPALVSISNLPESLLQSCIKVANEAPTDLKSNLRRAWANFSAKQIEVCVQPNEFQGCLFALCFFHALVLGRRRFGSQGWSRPYSFNTGDLLICSDVLRRYMDTAATSRSRSLPWDDLRYIFGEIMYGGHITDHWDRITNNTYLNEVFTREILQGKELTVGFKCPDPSTYSYKGAEAHPEMGAYIHGLFMEGARWELPLKDGEKTSPFSYEIDGIPCGGHLVDPMPKELLPAAPVIYARAVVIDSRWEATAVGHFRRTNNVFDCPVYQTTLRGPTYVFLATLNTTHPKAKWILAVKNRAAPHSPICVLRGKSSSQFQSSLMSPNTSMSQDGSPRSQMRHSRSMDMGVARKINFDSQKVEVKALINAKKVFSDTAVETEVEWFYGPLGVHDFYFCGQSPAVIAQHIQSLLAAKLMSKAKEVKLEQEGENGAFFAVLSNVKGSYDEPTRRAARYDAGITETEVLERRLERQYLSGSSGIIGDGVKAGYQHLEKAESHKKRTYRMQCYRTSGVLDPVTVPYHVRMYFLQEPQFVDPTVSENETDINKVADKVFLERAGDRLKGVYQECITKAMSQTTPTFHTEVWSESDGSKMARVAIAYRSGATHSYFSSIADVYRQHGLFSQRKYTEFFANGIVIYTFYLQMLDTPTHGTGDFEARLAAVIKDASMHFTLPRTSLTPMLTDGLLNPQQIAYAYAAWKFTFHFMHRLPESFALVSKSLRDRDPSAFARLEQLRSSMKLNTFTESQILDHILSSADIVKVLYNEFVALHAPGKKAEVDTNTTMSTLRKSIVAEQALQIFSMFHVFNLHIKKTNFFANDKAALAFRLDGSFLSKTEFPDEPYAVVYVIGSEFRGFHVRFLDVARGGIRMIRSSHAQVYLNNASSLFDECYGLASTQHRKNKDIPEGGSKGVVLLNQAHQDKADVAFRKYIDAMLDIMLMKEGGEDILFLGPDEGTAHLMDWASSHAKNRGYSYWKAITTGKSATRGGIPHDVYGMTTHSVREYVVGIQRKLQLQAPITKVQTGGPDGDLGSNEIKMSPQEQTVAVVDGSGVLYDPKGIDRESLVALAESRSPISGFDMSKLSPEGYAVLVSQNDVTLPSGEVVENGTQFRNFYHLRPNVTADFFVPCGGRPAAVNLNNVEQFMYREDGRTLRFKYIVEGANLFFTQDARQRLEDAGVILFKDASANKGGVTSSSLEVLAALAMTDADFTEHMQVDEATGKIPDFYAAYVSEVQKRIDLNAQREFECIWREHERTGTYFSELTNQLSERITDLSAKVQHSGLWENKALREKIFTDGFPEILLSKTTKEELLSRLPESYTRALFASQLASRFIYSVGLGAPEFSFYEFIEELIGGSN
ncbi:hypothetical protein BBO99_00003937 [Phytophthora kernoviae]|uniref:Glutamate/phenylalanine/leucine/valine/L-tryptophan dehydrogenase C-terminal domain-containing protein n=1 Tax=Phytophthora kernoviae TaxID=325452 RepID=A0A3R7HJM8_9STRA|nr:hypothetical protein BBO99_00003937 [Phytophthora kernoviae]